ncbi:hypothetical protein WAI453_009549 [Rhynchosporium graminicola]
MSGSMSNRTGTPPPPVTANSTFQIEIEKEEPKLQNRRLFVCCDGTWIVGDVEGQQLTNVSKVARCIDYVDTWQPKKPMKGDMHREGDIMNKKDETPNNQAIELIDASETDDQPTTEDAAKTNDGTEAEKGVDKIPSPRNFVQIVHYQLGIGTGTGRIANNLDAMTGTGEKIVLLKTIRDLILRLL